MSNTQILQNEKRENTISTFSKTKYKKNSKLKSKLLQVESAQHLASTMNERMLGSKMSH